MGTVRTHEAIERAIAEEARRREERAALLGRLAVASEAELRDEIECIAAPRPPSGAWFKHHPQPSAPDEPLRFPRCLTEADRCTVPASAGAACDPKGALVQLYVHSSGLGGMFGVFAITATQPVTGSLWYSFEPPESGILAVIAQVALSGSMSVYTTGGPLLNLLPTVHAEAKLTLRLSVHQPGSVQSSELVVGSMRASGGSRDILRFDNDIYVIGLQAGVREENSATIQVSADLRAVGRSSFAHADFQFSLGGRGIAVPVLCLNWTPSIVIS